MRRACLVGLIGFLMTILGGPASAQVPKTFAAFSPMLGRDVLFLTDLDLPTGQGPFPVIVLMHGCAGVTDVERRWRRVYRERGYATLIIESLQARGWPASICTAIRQQSREGVLDRAAEAFAAARLLRSLPMIDPERIALMGFSHGGTVALLVANGVAFSHYVKIGLVNAPERYDAVIANYGYCVTPENAKWYFAGETEKLVSPLLILNGEKDDVTLASFCERYVKNHQARNPDTLKLVVLPDAYHAYDNGKPVAQYMVCKFNGQCDQWAHYGGNDTAYRQAQAAIAEFLDHHLRRSENRP